MLSSLASAAQSVVHTYRPTNIAILNYTTDWLNIRPVHRESGARPFASVVFQQKRNILTIQAIEQPSIHSRTMIHKLYQLACLHIDVKPCLCRII